mmetsp:Transcript_2011/g.5604  ORF Transcript_2011/g.5604 Transcript_2011/m.5604 type:complete len:196 (-) Transcript_2011:84-671(-)
MVPSLTKAAVACSRPCSAVARLHSAPSGCTAASKSAAVNLNGIGWGVKGGAVGSGELGGVPGPAAFGTSGGSRCGLRDGEGMAVLAFASGELGGVPGAAAFGTSCGSRCGLRARSPQRRGRLAHGSGAAQRFAGLEATGSVPAPGASTLPLSSARASRKISERTRLPPARGRIHASHRFLKRNADHAVASCAVQM